MGWEISKAVGIDAKYYDTLHAAKIVRTIPH